MHKVVILLTKADNKEDAIANVSEFMEGYQDQVWDWYSIGGRWHNILAPKYKEFIEKAKSITSVENGYITEGNIKIRDSEYQKIWNDFGMEGKHPWYNNYELGSEGNYYDIYPLKDCLERVKDWLSEEDKRDRANKIYAEMELAKAQEDENGQGGTMSAYYARKYAETLYQDFGWEIMVYDINKYFADTIPQDIEGYWAVVIDMHN